ncbi:alpha/beta fold hydrolase [Neptunicella marina]|nr:alpha/beta fold hydrolase [Neptunicella marina]
MTIAAMAKAKGYSLNTVHFTTADGKQLNVINVRAKQVPDKSPVLLVHGAGVRADIFCAPVETSIVDALLEAGYDVWLENWRASIDFPANEWTLDQAAVFDHPAAVNVVCEQTGAQQIKALIHCQGSTSFCMSAAAGLVPQVNAIVSNAVSLHPMVPKWSNFKLSYMLPVVRKLTDYLNPQWGKHAPTAMAKVISAMVSMTHHECNNPVCKQVSFTYGSGFPALWSHENLNEATHDWLRDEFAAVPLRFFTQITASIKKGNLLSAEKFDQIPTEFGVKPLATNARFSLFAGQDNLCFLPQSQEKTFEYLCQTDSDRHALFILKGYGHLDVFMGKRAAEDVFPLMIEELDKSA